MPCSALMKLVPSMPAIEIRTATTADLSAVTAIYGAAVAGGTASFELTPPDEDEMRRRFETITGAGFPYLVATSDGRVLGYALVSQYRPRPAYRYSVENSIYVALDAHRSGVGRRLLDALIAACTTQGFRQMIAVIGDSRQAASIGLHRAAGFTFAGTIHSVGYKHGRWLDSVLMQRPLGPGDTTPPSA